MRRTQRLYYGAVLLNDELRGLRHDVPSHQRTVCHQTIHHLQHVRGTLCNLPHWPVQYLMTLHHTLTSSPPSSFPSLCRQVADRLFSSFGQDILDALYWTATEPKEKKRAHIGVIPHFLMAVLYVCILKNITDIKMVKS